MITVRNTNPYFRGTAEGVQFKQATGGAIGLASPKAAKKLAATDGFFIDSTDDQAKAGSEPDPGDAQEKDPATHSKAGNAPAALSPDDDSVTQIKGIGPAGKEKLANAGIITLQQMVSPPAGVIASTLGVSDEDAAAYQVAAREILDAS